MGLISSACLLAPKRSVGGRKIAFSAIERATGTILTERPCPYCSTFNIPGTNKQNITYLVEVHTISRRRRCCQRLSPIPSDSQRNVVVIVLEQKTRPCGIRDSTFCCTGRSSSRCGRSADPRRNSGAKEKSSSATGQRC